MSNEAICKERTFFVSYGTARNLSKRIITSLSAQYRRHTVSHIESEHEILFKYLIVSL